MAKKPLYQALAGHVAWNPTGPPFVGQKVDLIQSLVDMLPSGSGWDMGTEIDMAKSTPQKLVLFGGFHHMSEHGYYDGWTKYTITVRPSLAWGFSLVISGRDRNDIKDYLYEMFDCALRQEVEEFPRVQGALEDAQEESGE